MTGRIAHRGPDDTGIWIDQQAGIALGHRRLAIMDLSVNGGQPMRSSSGRYIIIFNGEIYNAHEVRSALESGGHVTAWRGHSDTEILLAAIDVWGISQALTRSVGMFAIAIWDRKTETLQLARDRIGEKPLYYGRTKGSFLFASELKAICAVGAPHLEINPAALYQYSRFGYISGSNCIWKDFFKLLPGHVIKIDRDGSFSNPEPFWSLTECVSDDLHAEVINSDEAELITMVHDRIFNAVGSQMAADVPLGAFLSGGIDSSLVVAMMQAQTTSPVRTYTIGFDEKAFDEAPFAAAVAKHIGTEHTQLRIDASEALAVIPDIPSIYDEPFADSSQIPTVLVSRLTRRHVKVALSGDGGDELFAGYPRYMLAQKAWRASRGMPIQLRELGAFCADSLSPSTWDRILSFMLPKSLSASINGHRIHKMSRMLRCNDLKDFYTTLVSQSALRLTNTSKAWCEVGRGWASVGDDIEKMRRWDIANYLPDDLMVKVDRAAMSASLETRAPLLDHRVVELSLALPSSLLARAGTGKWVLRKILDRYVPRELVDRPKSGFAVPLAKWIRAPLHEWAYDLLRPQRIKEEGFFDVEQISLLWNQHQTGRYDHSSALWNVLMFQAWYELNKPSVVVR